jgi:hypothetical protein
MAERDEPLYLDLVDYRGGCHLLDTVQRQQRRNYHSNRARRTMSKEALSRFLKHVSEDPELQGKLIEFAAKQGFEFTSDELTDADLDSISGGPNRRVETFTMPDAVKSVDLTPLPEIDTKTP